MRAPLARLAVVVLVVLVAAGCSGGGGGTTGSGNVQTQDRPVAPFTTIEFSTPGTVTIEQTGTDSLRVEADENIQGLLTTEVQGSTLKLGAQPGAEIGRATIDYRITVRQLAGVVLSGAGTVTATGVDGPDLSLANSGAGSITASGRTDQLNVDLVGVGAIDTRGLVAQAADVSVGGAGTATVNAARTLDARITGVGSIVYLGDPAVTQNVSGFGTVSRG
ncbi:head GIN domain-containing protein [Actinomycetospora rhizophila]|uniref:Head GIN domain-containing protein n=1 Tax=Actinomycetospora rhizophila TaxID=1416876 RepID=A0ABV9ZFT6_9PSEU